MWPVTEEWGKLCLWPQSSWETRRALMAKNQPQCFRKLFSSPAPRGAARGTVWNRARIRALPESCLEAQLRGRAEEI